MNLKRRTIRAAASEAPLRKMIIPTMFPSRVGRCERYQEHQMNTLQTPSRIEYWAIERLVEYARNPRKNDAAVDRMCASIREFGLEIPVLARSNGEVVDGHLRLKAAKKLGI